MSKTKKGETVLFVDGISGNEVEAKVLHVNRDDDTIDIEYPHPYATDVMATCDRVQEGSGAWHWRPLEEKEAPPAPPEDDREEEEREDMPPSPDEEASGEDTSEGVTIRRTARTE
jgi:hypothetical protein